MNVFLARQPILDVKQRIRAYEILYRSGYTNHYSAADPDEASSVVVLDTFQHLGLDSLTGGNPAFINFSSRLLAMDIATLFPSKYLVIELLESVESSPEVLEKCRELKAAGYTIALDDFVYTASSEPFLEVADIVKVDFQAADCSELADLVAVLQSRGLTMLAEKVENWEELELARDLGFTMFQGYYFSRPEIVTAKRLLPLQLICLELIAAVNRPEMDYKEVTAIISRDLSLTYSLLRLVNSAAFFPRHRIESVQQALVFLGEKEIKKWVSLIAMQQMRTTKLDAPVITSLVRGRFSELLADKTHLREKSGALFLSGLFSMLDVLLQRPMEMILEEVHAPPEVQQLLLEGSGPYEDIGSLVFAYEQGRWGDMEQYATRLRLEPEVVTQAYIEAIRWCPGSLD